MHIVPVTICGGKYIERTCMTTYTTYVNIPLNNVFSVIY